MGQPGSWPILVCKIQFASLTKPGKRSPATIFCPALQPKAWANSDMFETTLSMRKMGNECGFVVTARRATSGRMFEHHE